jgi:hypothetical protein
MVLKRADVESFLSRDWDRVARAKDAYWQRVRRRLGPEALLAAADELHRQAQELNPGWPNADEREEDRKTHERVSAILRRTNVPAR